jgi:hypothetical protein
MTEHEPGVVKAGSPELRSHGEPFGRWFNDVLLNRIMETLMPATPQEIRELAERHSRDDSVPKQWRGRPGPLEVAIHVILCKGLLDWRAALRSCSITESGFLMEADLALAVIEARPDVLEHLEGVELERAWVSVTRQFPQGARSARGVVALAKARGGRWEPAVKLARIQAFEALFADVFAGVKLVVELPAFRGTVPASSIGPALEVDRAEFLRPEKGVLPAAEAPEPVPPQPPPASSAPSGNVLILSLEAPPRPAELTVWINGGSGNVREWSAGSWRPVELEGRPELRADVRGFVVQEAEAAAGKLGWDPLRKAKALEAKFGPGVTVFGDVPLQELAKLVHKMREQGLAKK